ncbi:MAG: DUF5615 family PIN-like protein, partial [Bdellovibrionota bacterium]
MKFRFLVDEDLPRGLARALRDAGHEAVDVRDVDLDGKPDEEIFVYAQSHALTVITADTDFSDISQFEGKSHSGVVLIRLPNDWLAPAL